MDKEENISSDFLDDIDQQMKDIVTVSSEFSIVKEMYVSKSGHTRLLQARRFGKTYMLKCLKPDHLYTPLYRMDLTKEFEIGLQLDHTNIRRTIGFEELDGLGPTIVLEYVDGETLESLMDKHQLDKPLARKLVGQLIDVLGYMHSKQTIHRDLKPSNIMVTHKGQNVKLIDFSLSDNDAFNVLKEPGGTSGYIAPELFQPGAQADITCDIYSFGVLLANMAEASGDRALMQPARQCMDHMQERRPQSMDEITIPEDTTLLQVAALVLLLLLAIFLCACIAVRVQQIL